MKSLDAMCGAWPRAPDGINVVGREREQGDRCCFDPVLACPTGAHAHARGLEDAPAVPPSRALGPRPGRHGARDRSTSGQVGSYDMSCSRSPALARL